MTFIRNHIASILFIIIALIICLLSDGFQDKTWTVSLITSVIGGFIVEKVQNVILTSEEKKKVKLNVKAEMRRNVNRLHDITSKAFGVAETLKNSDSQNKDFCSLHSSLKNAVEELGNLEKYFSK